jgi:Zn-dependent protease with chaperone function
MFHKERTMDVKPTILVITLFTTGIAAYAQVRQFKPGFNLFSKEQDIQLGKESAAQIRRQMPIVKNPELQQYVQRIGQKLAATPLVSREHYPFTWEVVNDKSINAFALPGGPMFIHTGLLTAADNEAQVAGVLAHEMAHVVLRHGTNQASKQNFFQLPLMLAGAVMGDGMLSQLAQLGIGIGSNSVLMKFSRNAERDADLMGAQIMNQAGYNPVEMARFFEKLEGRTGKGNAITQLLSDHPNPGNRVKEVEAEVKTLPKIQYNAASGNFEHAKTIAAAIPPPASKTASSPQNAFAAGPEAARPSGNFKQFSGREFSIAYPDNWEVLGDMNAGAVILAPRSSVKQSGNRSAIGYGMMASVYIPQDGGSDLRTDTDALLKQLQSQLPGMKISSPTAHLRLDNQPALLNTMSSQSPYPNLTESDLLITVPHKEGLLYFLFIVPQSEVNQVDKVIKGMVESLRLATQPQ